jgi:hypothetical protein
MATPKFIVGRSGLEERNVLEDVRMRMALFLVLENLNGFYCVSGMGPTGEREIGCFDNICFLRWNTTKLVSLEWENLMIIIVDKEMKTLTSDKEIELMEYFSDMEKFWKLPRVEEIYHALAPFKEGEKAN